MKQKTILKYFLILSIIFSIQSCEDDSDSMLDEDLFGWQTSTRLAISPVEDKETFIWYKDLLTNEEYWGSETVELEIELKSKISLDNFSKVDFYVTVEEKDGYNYTTPFSTDGKLVSSVQVPESGKFSLELSAEDLYGLYINDFQNDRSEKLANKGDIFLVYWVITSYDGSVLDSREALNYDRYGIIVKVEDFAPPVWEGVFDYEIIDLGYSYGEAIGDTGVITIIHEGEGVYNVSSLTFNYTYSGPGTLIFDFLSGLTYVDPNDNYDDVVWNISNINGTSLDIYWTYYWTASYGEWSKVTLTRRDGANWPTNIYTD